VDEIDRKARIPEVTQDVRVMELTFEDPGKPVSAPAKAAAPKAPASPGAVSEDELARAVARKNAAPATPKAAPVPAKAAPEVSAEEPVEEKGEEPGDEVGHKAAAPKVQQGSILRVDSRRIDNLLNLVSETVINKATFNQINSPVLELQGTFLAVQSDFRDKLKELFDEVNEALASGKSVKDVKKGLQERWGELASSYDSFEADFKTTVASSGPRPRTGPHHRRASGRRHAHSHGAHQPDFLPVPRLVRDHFQESE
jgi:two-component system chemotaxis sensor kinase CheA